MHNVLSNNRLIYVISLTVLFISAFFSLNKPEYTVLALPLILLVAGVFLISIEKAFLFIVFCTPLSVKYLIGTSVINLPNEPLMIVMLLLFIIVLAKQNLADFYFIIKHPITIIVFINLLWLFITSITSTSPLVSFKFLIARIWTVVFGLLWGAIIFKNLKNIKHFFLAFGIGLCLVILYTTYNHYLLGFSQEKCMMVMHPFMDDHTVYSAVCSIILVFFIVAIKRFSSIQQVGVMLIIFLSALGVMLSYSRAAWISLVFVVFFGLLLKFRLKFKTLLLSLLMLMAVAAVFSNQIYQRIKFNKVVSGKSLSSDIQSISNVTTDESNVERLNRWESGYRMFLEKPFFGFGPGTYMFEYSPYQRAHEMTGISTTHGDMGSMHSEYFGPLVETGVLGFLITIILFFVFIAILMRVYYHSLDKNLRVYALAILLAMLSYLAHGVLNNFIDQDKIAVLFWGMMGMAVAIDYHFKKTFTNRLS